MGRSGGRGMGGGGRSFGGGGRSFSGGRMGGGISRGGGLGSRPSAGFGGYYRPRPVYRPRPMFRPHFHPRIGGWGYMPRRRYGGCGCFSMVAAVVAVLFITVVFSSLTYVNWGVASTGSTYAGVSQTQIVRSTQKRTPLPRGSARETGYYTDRLGWISNSTRLTAGMKNFYNKTGVQPYLYITDTVNGTNYPTDRDAEIFMNDLYDSLFDDEAHLLLLFFEYNEVTYRWILTGTQASAVIDAEARDILFSYIDRYYFDKNLTDEEYFSKAFNDAGNRIMSVTRSPWIIVWVVIGAVVIIVVLFLWWKRKQDERAREAEETERILNTPLETFGNDT